METRLGTPSLHNVTRVKENLLTETIEILVETVNANHLTVMTEDLEHTVTANRLIATIKPLDLKVIANPLIGMIAALSAMIKDLETQTLAIQTTVDVLLG